MGPPTEQSQLKRGRVQSQATEDRESSKKVRRSERLSQATHPTTPVSKKHNLPSPVTHDHSGESSDQQYKEGTATPPEGRPSQIHHHEPNTPHDQRFSSPPQDTQAFSQITGPRKTLSDEVKDETEEGVWGYLFPQKPQTGKPLILKKRNACPLPEGLPEFGKPAKNYESKDFVQEEEAFEKTKFKGVAASGYLIGRHLECDTIIDDPIVSNRHCLIFPENKDGNTIAMLEDTSSNGTFINEGLLGRNKRRELKDNDEITIMDSARWVFKYPKTRRTTSFLQRYTLLEKLGKGHFAEVFLCVEKATGNRFAVKIFTVHEGTDERSKVEGLQQEIAVLMGVAHPNMLCLKDAIHEPGAVYLVLELAAEGELFNTIVMKQKLTETETRKVFIQLFQGVKYLHERGIVHRDIKPENILLTDKELSLKLADFGLAKIIGEESFTHTLCGTPSYVAPEILEDGKHRRYTRAVDVWSLGVVLYICLCGFPPFSDELYTKENPYSLTQQIKTGRFDYPSPYWDSVGDPALDLIDRMLTVDVSKRYTIDDCLSHPWTTHNMPNVNDSTDGLVGGISGLDFSHRKIQRERTLLSTINEVKITKIIPFEEQDPVKVYIKNPNTENGKVKATPKKGQPAQEETPAKNRDAKEFIGLGGKGDQNLFDAQEDSNYSKSDVVKKKK